MEMYRKSNLVKMEALAIDANILMHLQSFEDSFVKHLSEWFYSFFVDTSDDIALDACVIDFEHSLDAIKNPRSLECVLCVIRVYPYEECEMLCEVNSFEQRVLNVYDLYGQLESDGLKQAFKQASLAELSFFETYSKTTHFKILNKLISQLTMLNASLVYFDAECLRQTMKSFFESYLFKEFNYEWAGDMDSLIPSTAVERADESFFRALKTIVLLHEFVDRGNSSSGRIALNSLIGLEIPFCSAAFHFFKHLGVSFGNCRSLDMLSMTTDKWISKAFGSSFQINTDTIAWSEKMKQFKAFRLTDFQEPFFDFPHILNIRDTRDLPLLTLDLKGDDERIATSLLNAFIATANAQRDLRGKVVIFVNTFMLRFMEGDRTFLVIQSKT